MHGIVAKVKQDALRIHDSLFHLRRTISDVLSEMNASISTEEEILLLIEELKTCKFQRCCYEEEVIALAKKLLSMPCTKYNRAYIILEILTLSSVIAEKISEIVNTSMLDLCIESIDLFKEFLIENPTDNEARLLLSVDYYCLYCLKLQQLHKVAEKESELCLKSGLEDEENDNCDIQPVFPLVTFLVEAEVIKSLEMSLEIWTDISKNSENNWKEFAGIIKNGIF
ncbi:hypothetical protein CEXT_783471 [Caerostris extrusa]|uniref:Uncharacterized protein n=1 Tax=Caerostris extrusa TaxID=172846 RepID=A0AAV4N2P0_CAEEX|nr:hypothetical protein CEXT_783471 [Caerostris extrusa]